MSLPQHHSHHAHNQHTLVNHHHQQQHAWKPASSQSDSNSRSIDRFLTKTKQRFSSNHHYHKVTRGGGSSVGDTSTIITESTGYSSIVSSQSSLASSRGSKSPVSPLVRKTNRPIGSSSSSPSFNQQQTPNPPCSPTFSIRTDSATNHQTSNEEGPPLLPCTEVLPTDPRGTITTTTTSLTPMRPSSRYHHQRGVFQRDNNDDLQKPPPPRSPKVRLGAGHSLENESQGSPRNGHSPGPRPRPLSRAERSLSSESTASSSSAVLPRPPETARAVLDALSFAVGTTDEHNNNHSSINNHCSSNSGPIDIDTMEAWQDDAASVDSSSLIMMNIEDPAELQQQPLSPLPPSSSGQIMPLQQEQRPPSLVDTTASPQSSSSQSEQRQTIGTSNSNSPGDNKSECLDGWGSASLTSKPPPPSPAETTVRLEQSSFWNTDNDDDSDSSSPYLDDTLSSAGVDGEDDYADSTSTSNASGLVQRPPQPQTIPEEELDEQDTDPLAALMRLDRIEDVIAESDDEEEVQLLLEQFHRFPILDERDSERVLAGYQRGFEPDYRRHDDSDTTKPPVPSTPSPNVAFEI